MAPAGSDLLQRLHGARTISTLDLAPGAELIGWDVAALGLPEAQLPFEQGSLLQHLELRDAWLERGRIAASDARLINGPLGLASQRCIATLFLASGSDLSRGRAAIRHWNWRAKSLRLTH